MKAWRRWRSRFFLPLLLFLLWLLLNQSMSIGHMVLGAALAAFVVTATASMRPLRASLRYPRVALTLFWVVLVDLIKSNLTVAAVITGPERRRHKGGFIDIPLDMRDPHGLSVLGMIVTFLPGTVWTDLSEDGRTLTIHVLELDDDDYWPGAIKERYEKPLMEIFE